LKRNLEKLKSEVFDVVIIGGGIHGALILWEAARNGYKACLIDKTDFGSHTSANSLKVLHGGFRYIQHANIKRMRESIYSRKIFQKIAPHLVKNIPFLFPTSGFGVKSRLSLSIALFLNDIISCDRNSGLTESSRLKGGRTIGKKKLFKILPELKNQKINGGAIWYESVALNTERLLFEFLHEAYEMGAELCNYIRAEELIIENNKARVKVKDEISGEEFILNSEFVVDSVGPWLNNLLTQKTDLNRLKSGLTKAVNIIIKKNYFDEFGVGLESVKEFVDKDAIINKGKRLFFLVPIGDFTMIGTTYKVFQEDPDMCRISDEDVKQILDEVNESYKGFNITIDDVVQSHVGVLPMHEENHSNEFDVQPEKHSLVFDHSCSSIKNLISVKSVKYTTAPSIAEQVLKVLSSKFPKAPIQNKDSLLKQSYSELKDQFFKTYSGKYTFSLLQRLWNTYGVKSNMVIEYIDKDSDSKKMIIEEEEVYNGELNYNFEQEMAITSDDFISRRLGLSAFEKMPDVYFEKIEKFLSSKK